MTHRISIFSLAVATLLAGATALDSQYPATPNAGQPAPLQPAVPTAVLAELDSIRARNAEILKTQQVTLKSLAELREAARQAKIFAKRG